MNVPSPLPRLHPFSQPLILTLLLAAGVAASLEAQTPAEALDQPVWQFDLPEVQQSPRLRVVTGNASHDGTDALAGDNGLGETVVLSTVVDGPGEFSFWWRSYGQVNTDRLRFTAASQASLPMESSAYSKDITGIVPWTRHRISLPPGRVNLTWTQLRSGIQMPETVGVWLDQFEFNASGGPVTVAEGVDNGTIAWTVEGNGEWRGRGSAGGEPDYGLFFKPANSLTRLRGAIPPGWFSINYSPNVKFTAPAGIQFADSAQMAFGWRRLSGWLPQSSEAIIEVEGGGGAEGGMDECLTIPKNISIGEAVEAPQIQWTPRPSAAAWKASPLPFDAWDGVDAAVPAGGSSTSSLDGAFTGPAELRARVRNVKSTNAGTAQLEGPGNSTGWREQRWLLPPGGNVLTWTGGSLDDVRITPFELIPAAQATGAPSLTWTDTNAASGGWYGVNDSANSHDGNGLLRSGPLANASSATASWSGAGALQFHWRYNVSAVLDEVFSLSSTSAAWRSVYCELPGGNHTARFIANHVAAGTYSELDEFTWNPGTSPWRTALENPSGLLAGSGDALWQVSGIGAHTGGSSLASPALTSGQTAKVHLRTTGPATLKFRWRHLPDRQSQPVVGTVSANGKTCQISTPFDWEEKSMPLGSGEQNVIWSVTPLSSEGCAPGALLLDDVRIESPYSNPQTVSSSAAAATGLAGQPFTVSGEYAGVTASSAADAHDGVSALRLQSPAQLPASYPARLETTLNGPFELSFWWRVQQGRFFLDIDGVRWLELVQPASAALEAGAWRRAVATVLAPGPHTLTFIDNSSRSFWLDDMEVKAPGSAGTFSAAVGSPPLDWAIPDLGTDHALPDPSAPRGGSTGAKLGAGTPLFRCRTAGPAILSGWWRGDIPDGRFSILNDFSGAFAARVKSSGKWQPFQVFVPGTGPQWLRWQPQNMSGLPPEAVRLDSITAEPYRDPTIGETLGSPSLAWSATPQDLWKPSFTLNERRIDYTSSSISPIPQVSVPLTGPGWLYLAYSPGLTFDFDGTIRNGGFFFPVASGSHTARWQLLTEPGNNSISLRYPCRLVPDTGLSAEAGMDLPAVPGLTLLAPSGMTGLADEELSVDGEDCAISGPLPGNPVTVRWSVTGPGRLLYSSAAAGTSARLTGQLDSTTLFSGRILDGWTYDEIAVPAGVHEVSLQVESISGPGIPDSFLLLDRVRLESEAAATSQSTPAFDNSGRVWRERAVSPFTEMPGVETYPSPVGGTFARSALMAPGDSTWLETEVSGPGFVTVKLVNLTGAPPLPPGTATNGSIEAAWGNTKMILSAGESRFRIPETGPQVFRLTFKNGSVAATGTGSWRWFGLDAFHFLPDSAPAIALGDALDAPSLTWTSAPGHWSGVDFGSFGEYAIAAGNTASLTRVLGLTLPGPGTLTWNWKLSVSSSNILSLFNPRENTLYHAGPQGTNWSTASQFIVPQQQVWEFRAANLGTNQFAQLDSVSFTPAPVVSVSEALDLPERTWTMSSPDAWRSIQVPPGSEPAAGGDALLSGVLNHSQSAWIETVVTPPAYVSFDWKANSESADVIRFSINGTVAATKSGTGITASYSTFERHLTGTTPVTLRWTYSKNASVHAGKDTAFLDKFVLLEFPPGDINSAANTSGLTLTAGGSNGYTFLPLATPAALSGGSSAAFFGSAPQLNPPASAQAWLDTTATGPGVLSFAWKGSIDLVVDGSTQGPGAPGLSVTLDRNNWQRTWRYFSDTGTHSIRVRANSPGTLDSPAMVDEVRFDSILPLAAVNGAGITWSTGSPEWFAFGNAGNQTLAASIQSTTGSYAEASITGPGLLRFTAGGKGALSFDGFRVALINSVSGSGAYSPFGCFVPPGAHTLRWTCAGTERLWLYGVNFSPPGELWLPDLLDAPSLFMMSTGPDSYVSGTDLPRVAGNPFLAWKAGTAPLDVLLPGSGHLQASWSQAIPWEAADPPQLAINSASSSPCPGLNQWVASASAEYFVPALVRLSLQGYSPPDSPETLLRVDGLKFVEANAVNPAVALECPSLNGMSLQGWSGRADQALSFDGVDLLVADMGPLNPVATASATLEGPAVLTFAWKVPTTSETLTLSVDGVTLTRKATTGWTTMRLELGSGTHSVVWSAQSSAAAGRAMLDAFTCTPGTPFLDYLSPNVPALFAATDTLSIVTRSGITGLVSNGTSAAEYLLPGPSITGPPDPTGTFLSHTGLLLKSLSFASSPPPPPITSLPVWKLTPASLAEALDTGLALTTSGGWAASSVGPFDFAWVRQTPGSPAQWMETVLHGPGTLSWANPFFSTGGSGLPNALIDGVTAGPVNSVRLTESRDYTVRWSAGAPLIGTSTFALDQLIWAPDTVDTNPALWLETFGITGSAAALSADPDGDGNNNLMEFAFGGNPSVPGALDVTPLLVSEDGGHLPAIAFKRRNHPRLVYQLERLRWNGWQGEQAYQADPLSGDGPFFSTRFVSREALPLDVSAREPVFLRILVSWTP